MTGWKQFTAEPPRVSWRERLRAWAPNDLEDDVKDDDKHPLDLVLGCLKQATDVVIRVRLGDSSDPRLSLDAARLELQRALERLEALR